MNKKIYRSTDDRLLAGVIGGLAEYWSIDSTKLRIIFAILLVVSLSTLTLLYLLLWFIIPQKPSTTDFVEEDVVDETNDREEEN
ncbi:hypothetical protein FC62_GL000483 [Amylolactobacillus amylotrophicus DSM 20534]|uniref:Uncharacterized protein n=3 Tax=Amylolactobacillus TaxID=2767876 RepID=A0A0R1YRS9_9LACO|nr:MULTISPECIES: PspC domain-containing protein [Amylolactobacillus]APT18950.1 hypothetical protein LA20533_06675 [Amylolactobacillus amylophilus DSM 20533 = JCM 1125]KRK38791.1 hypothetical protein FC62_GL000483 [Amylolactobacillus amylotrophicus DSM 20534]KRM42566.1 hypothetical protein FD40_GL000357 [Amylolactobacillus amylophilus DSM 20533 = JCM 1125]GED80012.1 hypothetical protein LAM01_04850 [Amylolactobacillus amylophilus]